MNDLISKKAAIDMIDKYINQFDCIDVNFLDGLKDAKKILNDLLSAERRGRWEHLGGDEWFCTACGHVITTEGSWERPWQKYCEECGAKMMNEDEEMSKVSEMEMAYGEYLNG